MKEKIGTYEEEIKEEEIKEAEEKIKEYIDDINNQNEEITRNKLEEIQAKEEEEKQKKEEYYKEIEEAYINKKLAAEEKKREEFKEYLASLEEEEKEEANKKKEKKGWGIFGKKEKEKKETKEKETKEEKVQREKEEEELEELRKALYKDELTGLYNNRKYKEDIEEIEIKEGLCIYSIDANNLKYINDTYGHEKGDILLKSVGEGLKKSFKGEERIYHLHGDEYAVIEEGRSLKEAEKKKAEFKKNLEEINKRIEKKEKGIVISAAIGCAMYIKGDKEITALFERADEAMYKDKKEYKETHPEYNVRGEKGKEEEKRGEGKEQRKEKRGKKEERKGKKEEKYKTREVSYDLPEEESFEYPGEYKASNIGENEYAIDEPSKDYIDWKEEIAKEKKKITEEEIREMIREITSKREELIMIAIVTEELNNLVLLKNPEEFFEFCGKSNIRLELSYIYVLYKDKAVYYMNKTDDAHIRKIFEDIRECFMSNTMITGQMISKIPNIGMFENIYIS